MLVLPRRGVLLIAAFVMLAVILMGPSPVSAHALNESYQLPVPLWLYLWGAFAAVAASFVIVLAADRAGSATESSRATPLPLGVGRVASFVLKVAGLVGWFAAMVTGLLGLVHEFLPATIFWTLFWAGLPVVAALIGNPWPSMSPFRTLYGLVTGLTRRELDLGVAYPGWARRWPAVGVLLVVLVIELTVPGSGFGRSVGLLMLAYTSLTLVGMAVFGPVAWLRNAEVFEVLLGWFGRLAPIGRESISAKLCDGCGEACDPAHCVDCPECSIVADPGELRPVLRTPLSGMAALNRAGWSDAAFIVLALAGVTYDGLQETALWLDLSRGIEAALAPALEPQVIFAVSDPIGLTGVWLTFLAIFAAGAWATRHVGGIDAPLTSTVGGWAASLLPIAAGYSIAHYGMLIVQGVLTLPGMFADPGAVEVILVWLPAGFVWYLSVAAIVIGHVAAVLLAHREGIRLGARRLTLAEVPLVALMLGYTVVSLWIIAQPITFEAR